MSENQTERKRKNSEKRKRRRKRDKRENKTSYDLYQVLIVIKKLL